ncbi:MAG TPA: MerR family transcriptional regulator [Candidatus Enterocloster faecavium]|uniref:MerR family transcriptional regulator n=1 Tax=Candidatus Enterocloster faecavium TaxID=2838560 RepID=A0A9D2RKR2_9FIRM|nr:MerR family transcriptional regulator [Candidatus Enterocloster faecavium]
MLYTVGEMARLADLPASTLRYYDQEGLLPFVERSKGGIRMFSEADYSTLMVIDCLKKSGLSIKEIRAFMALAQEGDSSLKERLAMFQKRREAVKEQIQELERTLDLLNYKCWYYETAVQAGSEAAVQGLCQEEIPQEFKEARASLNLKNH